MTTVLQTSTLRPGLLVSLKTSIHGGVNYQKETLDSERMTESGASKVRWETTRTIVDAKEHAAATKARSKAGAIIRGVCAQSAFGLLCPEQDSDKLAAAIKAARDVAEEFNATAKVTRVSVFVLTGRVAPDDVEAVKAINSEIKDLMEAMAEGIDKLDVKAVREAASKAKQVGNVLSADAQARVQMAVEAARNAARQIVKAGEDASVAIDASAIRRIREQRSAFLDMSDMKEVAAPVSAQQRVLKVVDNDPKAAAN
jgi:hypothetical protein